MQLISAILVSAVSLIASAGANKYHISQHKMNEAQALDYCYKRGSWLAAIDNRNLREIEQVMYTNRVHEVRAGHLAGHENRGDPIYKVSLYRGRAEVDMVAPNCYLKAICVKSTCENNYKRKRSCKARRSSKRRSYRKSCGRRRSHRYKDRSETYDGKYAFYDY